MFSVAMMAITVGATSCTRVPKSTYKNVKGDNLCATTTSSQTSTTTSVTTTETTSMTTTTDVTSSMMTTESETEMMNTMTETEVFVSETEINTEPIVYEPVTQNWNAVYYCGSEMGYSSNPCGASGNVLVPDYSVACDSLPFGTIIQVESDYISGTYRVDDCGVGVPDTLDFYFYDRTQIPEEFLNAGNVPITVTIVE